MYCNQIAFCTRYFADGEDAIEVAFLVIETEPSELRKAMAKYNVNPADFFVYIDAENKNQVDRLKLLVSTDGKYASVMEKQDDENVRMHGAYFRDFNIYGNSVDELLAKFQNLLFADETLFRQAGLRTSDFKLKNRINYADVNWESHYEIFEEVDQAIRYPEGATSDGLAMAIFQGGLNTWTHRQFVDSRPLIEELWKRIDNEGEQKYRFFDFSDSTPRELLARRARAESKLKELEAAMHEFADQPNFERVFAMASKLKGDVLAETAFLSAVRRSETMKALFWAVANYALEHRNRRIVY
jgi:hypothetical protein